MLNLNEARIVHAAAVLQNLAKRMERYGAISYSDYCKEDVDVNDVKKWNAHVLQIIYDDSQEIDDGEFVVLKGVCGPKNNLTKEYFSQLNVVYNVPEGREEGYLYVYFDVEDFDLQPTGTKRFHTRLSFVIGHDGLIEDMGLPAPEELREQNASGDCNFKHKETEYDN